MKSNTNPSAKAGQALARSGVAAVKDSRYPGGEGGQTPTGEGAPTRETGSRYARGEGDQERERQQERRAAGMPEEKEARRQQERERQQERRPAVTLYDIVLSSLVHIIHITASSVPLFMSLMCIMYGQT